MYEAQLNQLMQQTFNMESTALATENLRNTMATFDAMKVANKELKKQYGKIDIDKIEVHCPVIIHLHYRHMFEQNMHYDMEELLEQANEIQETLGRSYAIPDELDEADLEAGMRLLLLYLAFHQLILCQNSMRSRWRKRKAHLILPTSIRPQTSSTKRRRNLQR